MQLTPIYVALILIISALVGVLIAPTMDQAITTQATERWDVLSIDLDKDTYYIVGYREISDTEFEIKIVFMPKSVACLRIAMGEFPYYEEAIIYKFGLEAARTYCLYL